MTGAQILLLLTSLSAATFFITCVVFMVLRWRGYHSQEAHHPQRRIRYLVRSEDADAADTIQRSWPQTLGDHEDYEFIVMDKTIPWIVQTIQILRDNLEYSWDVVVLTDATMYFQPHKLQQWLQRNYPDDEPVRNLCAGTIGTYLRQPFISGTNMCLSRDVAATLVQRLEWDNTDLREDILISNALVDGHGVVLQELERQDLPDVSVAADVWSYRLKDTNDHAALHVQLTTRERAT